jgi:hypothetical protein
MEKIKVGDRVEATYEGIIVQGVVKSIYVEMTRGGPAAVYKVSIDKKGGSEISDAYEIDSPAHLWHTTTQGEPCADCGDVHDSGFNPEVMEVYARYQKASDAERSDLLVELARVFVVNVKDSDLAVPESMHEMASKAEEALFALDNLHARIGRHVVAYITESTKLKTWKDALGGLGARVMSLQDLQNTLDGKSASTPATLDLLSFDKKKVGSGHGSIN